MVRTPCGYHHSILMGNRPPSNWTGRMRIPTRHHRPHALPSPMGQGCAGGPPNRHRRHLHVGMETAGLAGAVRPVLCGHTRPLYSQPARGWLVPRLGCWPHDHRGRPVHSDPPRRLCARGSAPSPRAPRTAARGRCAHAHACHYH